MDSVESYEIPEHLIQFIEDEMEGTYFGNMLKSGMIATLSLEKLRYLNYIYLIKTKKYVKIIEKWELKDKFIKTIQSNIDFYISKEKSSEQYLTTHVISKHNLEYYKKTGLRDKNKNTLLNYAIKNCDFELAESELKYCSYGKPSIIGFTPLMNILESYSNDNGFNKKHLLNLFNIMIKKPLSCNLYQKNKFKKTVFEISLNIPDLYFFNKLIENCDCSRIDVENILEFIVNYRRFSFIYRLSKSKDKHIFLRKTLKNLIKYCSNDNILEKIDYKFNLINI